MNENQEYFLYLLSCKINNRKVEIYKEDVDWQEICNLANMHNLITIVFSAVNDLPSEFRPPLEIYNKLKKYVLLYAQKSARVDKLLQELIDTFEHKGLNHIIIKGYILKNYYPSPEYRSMTDVDILIKPQDRQKAHQIMMESGYENFIQEKTVWNYKKNKSHIEMHTQLIEKEIKQDIDYKKYFSNPWEHTQSLGREHSYTLNREYHLIYLLVHIAKHFYSCGCGVRMIMDIAVYLNKFDDLDWDYIWAELDKLDLRLLGQNILILCNKWFDTKLNFEYTIDQKFYDKLSETILLGGTFGFYNSNFRIAQIRNESKHNDSSKKARVLKQMIFPSYDEIIKLDQYKFLRGRKYLLGFAWIYRGFYQLKSRGIGSLGYVNSVLNSDKKIDEQREIMNKLGL
ncbi:nucleotidyltransferase domain-containing protein [Intestinibacter sp.]